MHRTALQKVTRAKKNISILLTLCATALVPSGAKGRPWLHPGNIIMKSSPSHHLERQGPVPLKILEDQTSFDRERLIELPEKVDEEAVSESVSEEESNPNKEEGSNEGVSETSSPVEQLPQKQDFNRRVVTEITELEPLPEILETAVDPGENTVDLEDILPLIREQVGEQEEAIIPFSMPNQTRTEEPNSVRRVRTKYEILD